MHQKIRWGVLSPAKIGTIKVLPAMQRSAYCEITAIASRSLDRARTAADELAIPKACGSYEELLADPDIDAIYNPLPNHLHVPWSIKALEAGKHVLCEKPVGLSTAEVRSLIEARNRCNRKIGEAFMIRLHPQWLRAKAICDSGELGEIRSFQCAFMYFNVDASNIRNQADIGGGAIMDIGCYPIHASRWFFDAEPTRVSAVLERDPTFRTDRLASAILEYPAGLATFTVATQLSAHQRVVLQGTKGSLEIEIPVNAPPDRDIHLWIRTPELRTEIIPAADQYTLQGDAFSRAILENTEVPVPLENAFGNMSVIEAVFRSAESGQWAKPEPLN